MFYTVTGTVVPAAANEAALAAATGAIVYEGKLYFGNGNAEGNGDEVMAVTKARTIKHTVSTSKKAITSYGYTRSQVAAQFDLGAATLALGYSEKDSNDPADKHKAKTTDIAVSGPIADSGFSFAVWGQNADGHDGQETTPWGLGLTRTLGGGAKTWIEHQNNDDDESGKTAIGLRVDF